MLVHVDSASSVPVYEQLREQLVRLITGGQLPPGARLPAIRQLAADLGIAPGTVSRAYSELEREGLLRTRRPQGTFVAAGAAGRRHGALLQGMADRFVEEARQLGVDSDEAVQALQASYRRAAKAGA
ncbi:MAG: putative regulator [Frankiales bacterium]|nr:putative regulator [Frankiales bacterium]